MAQSKRAPRTAAKKRAPAKKRKPRVSLPPLPVFTIMRHLLVLLFFVVSIAAVLYVIFFQVVVAAELRGPGSLPAAGSGCVHCRPDGLDAPTRHGDAQPPMDLIRGAHANGWCDVSLPHISLTGRPYPLVT